MNLDYRVVSLAGVAALAGVIFIALTFDRGPVESVQRGYRGTGMAQLYTRDAIAETAAANVVPEPSPAVEPSGQPSSAVYQNVKVLGNVDSNEFIRLMSDMTAWIAPEQGCGYCHNLNNLADESLYTYRVARRMIQMVQHINNDWQPHVAPAGVTCYTCHRGNKVPLNVWSEGSSAPLQAGLLAYRAGQNAPAPAAAYASLPFDPFTPFIGSSKAADARVNSETALPEGNRSSIKQTEWTYSFMMHMSQGLGVNCTYCHNTRAFSDWDQSSTQRVSAWHGIRMLRDLNENYIETTKPDLPPERLGALGDVPKINCTTCHQGAFKPLLGANMVKDYSGLGDVSTVAASMPSSTAAQPAPARR